MSKETNSKKLLCHKTETATAFSIVSHRVLPDKKTCMANVDLPKYCEY